MKKVAVSESHEMARVAYFGQITNIGRGRAQKLLKECSREVRDISVCGCAREKGWYLRITRNRIDSKFRPNNDYRMQSRAKIIKGAVPGGLGH